MSIKLIAKVKNFCSWISFGTFVFQVTPTLIVLIIPLVGVLSIMIILKYIVLSIALLIVTGILLLIFNQVFKLRLKTVKFMNAVKLVAPYLENKETALEDIFHIRNFYFNLGNQEAILYLLKLGNCGELKMFGQDAIAKDYSFDFQKLTPTTMPPDALTFHQGDPVIQDKFGGSIYNLRVDKKELFKIYRKLKINSFNC